MKDWLIEVVVQKGGPSAIRGAVLGLIGWLAVKENIIPGVHTDTATHITTIAWDQVSAWAIAGLPAITAAVIKMFQHQTQTIIKKEGEPKE